MHPGSSFGHFGCGSGGRSSIVVSEHVRISLGICWARAYIRDSDGLGVSLNHSVCGSCEAGCVAERCSAVGDMAFIR